MGLPVFLSQTMTGKPVVINLKRMTAPTPILNYKTGIRIFCYKTKTV